MAEMNTGRWGKEFTKRAVATYFVARGERRRLPRKEFGELMEGVVEGIVSEALEEERGKGQKRRRGKGRR